VVTRQGRRVRHSLPGGPATNLGLWINASPLLLGTPRVREIPPLDAGQAGREKPRLPEPQHLATNARSVAVRPRGDRSHDLSRTLNTPTPTPALILALRGVTPTLKHQSHQGVNARPTLRQSVAVAAAVPATNEGRSNRPDPAPTSPRHQLINRWESIGRGVTLVGHDGPVVTPREFPGALVIATRRGVGGKIPAQEGCRHPVSLKVGVWGRHRPHVRLVSGPSASTT
jgi:hypothetical protein